MDNVFADLVAIPTITSDFAAAHRAVDYCADYLTARGMHVEKFVSHQYPSLVATTRKTKRPKVLLGAHLDVVAAPKAMFKLRLEDGTYYGRGVWDMKFAAAIYLHIVDALLGRLDHYDFGIMFTTEEELFGEYGTGMLVNEQGIRPEVCILPDAIPPWCIQRSAKGCYFGEVSVVGISAHGSRPWEGDSASIKLVGILQAITALFGSDQRPETKTLNIGIMQSGASFNQIPDSAMATLDIRFGTLEEFAALEKQIADICAKGGGVLKQVGDIRVPVVCDLKHPLVKSFIKQIQLQHGTVPASVAANGTSDARFFPPHNIPCILVSPKGGGFHGRDEWLDAADYERYGHVIRNYLEDVAKTPRRPGTGIATITPVDSAADRAV